MKTTADNVRDAVAQHMQHHVLPSR
jgi:hypothetical protein